MKGVNKVFLIGNVGRIETRSTRTGSVVSASLATTSSYKDKDGTQVEQTEWHNLSFFGKLADIASRYITKGSQIYIEGALRTEKWQDKTTGQDRFKTGVVVRELKLLPKEGQSKENAPAQSQGDYYRPPASETPENDFFDDDIPF